MGANGAQTTVQELLAQAGVTINGDNAWDIRVHNNDLYSRLFKRLKGITGWHGMS
jgi:hypothetical protein